MSINDYKIGDELFRYVVMGGIFRFIVPGVRQYEDGNQIEVECQTCSHGWKCRLLLAQTDYGKIDSVHMLNEDEDDRQRHWHSNDGYHFWPTKKEARAQGYQKAIDRKNEEVRQAEDRLKALMKSRDELVTLLNTALEEATP